MKRRWGRTLEQIQLQSLVLPGIILLFVFSYIPMWGVLIAFQDFDITKGFAGSEWVGFKHFIEFFQSRDFVTVMKNTLSISMLKLLFGFPAPIILALMLNEVRQVKLKRFMQTATYMPYFLSWVVVSGMLFSLLGTDGGAVNDFLMAIGIIDEPIHFFGKSNMFWGILVGANVWKDVGFSSIVYLAAITGINPEYYEAAELDGATRLQQIRYITLPCIAPQIVILLILAISGILNAGFEDVYLLTSSWKNGILIPVADVIDTHVFRMGVESQRFSYATAVGLFKSVISVILLFGANKFSRKLTDSSLW